MVQNGFFIKFYMGSFYSILHRIYHFNYRGKSWSKISAKMGLVNREKMHKTAKFFLTPPILPTFLDLRERGVFMRLFLARGGGGFMRLF